jgi:Protein of Unknown function (DUF2784)
VPLSIVGFTCPLTLLENGLRVRAGEAGYRDGFISHYLVKAIYPPVLTPGVQVGLGVVLMLVAVVGYRGFLRQHVRGAAGATDAYRGSGLGNKLILRRIESSALKV